MLRTERLSLRPLRRDDAEALHRAFGDPEVMRYWSTLAHATLDRTRRWVDAAVLGAEQGGAIELAVVHGEETIGRVGFWRQEEIGFLFVRSAWGQGFAREAVGAGIEHAFAVKDWSEIRADVDPRNAGSLRLLERLGFERTGEAKRTYCIDGVWVDSVYLRLPRRPHMR
jgi:ribosomal-protein-alanine N-acetyltransferase